MLIGSFLCLILLIWMATKIGKQSMVLAVASFLFWPVLIYAVIHCWGDEESDIKLPFALFVVAAGYTWYAMFQMAKSFTEEEALFSIVQFLA
jgi:hypothetical protein